MTIPMTLLEYIEVRSKLAHARTRYSEVMHDVTVAMNSHEHPVQDVTQLEKVVDAWYDVIEACEYTLEHDSDNVWQKIKENQKQ